nr:ribonuclease R [Saprospiraceae bacterium]
MKAKVLSLLESKSNKAYSAKQVAKKLKVPQMISEVASYLSQLEKDGKAYQVAEGKFRLDRFYKKESSSSSSNPEGQVFKGKVDMTRSGSAYVVCEDLEKDVYVSSRKVGGALNGDTVEVRIFTGGRKTNPSGEIIKVTKRHTKEFIGTVYTSDNRTLVGSDNYGNPYDIWLHTEAGPPVENGDKVIVEVTEWAERPNHFPRGKVVEKLGKEGSDDIEMKAILLKNGFHLNFPDEVEKELSTIPEDISNEDTSGRADLRELDTFTIDPADAKDFDDALSFRKLDNGNVEVGVHIADVTHYIKEGMAMDKEAMERSTSVYLVDRVLPMLPEKLSNNLCSLRPNVDRLTFSALFELDKNNKVVKRWFGKAIIHSKRRFTYEEAQEVMDNRKGDFADSLLPLNEIAEKLREKRFKEGSINFETDEVRFKLDEEGYPIEIFVKERKPVHMLVEDFMLLANREVGAFIAEKKDGPEIPFIYRVHDLPDPMKIADFALFAKELGFNFDLSTPQKIARSFNRLTEASRTNSALEVLQPLAIRSMSKAVYTANNIGHYGLGFDYYSHFTSPIRRYSDVLAHRILEKNLKSVYRMDKEVLEKRCKYISEMERHAMDAERESIKYKQVEFLQKRVGEEYDGYVTGMIERGIFVELENVLCEGLIAFDAMDDYYEMTGHRLAARGQKTGRIIKMGDKIRVKLLGTDLGRRQIELELLKHYDKD